jgi:Mce-associated membrane protein
MTIAGRRRVMSGIAILMCLAAGALTALAAAALDSESDARAAVAAADSTLPLLLSYNVATLPTDLATGESVTTGTFARDYQALVSATLEPSARAKQVVTSATVAACSVVLASRGTVRLLAFINRQSSSAVKPVEQLEQSSVAVTMSKVDGRWLISALNPL